MDFLRAYILRLKHNLDVISIPPLALLEEQVLHRGIFMQNSAYLRFLILYSEALGTP